MKTLEKGQDRVKHICDVLRNNTIEPAKEEAEQVITEAHAEAERIIAAAEKEAQTKIQAAKDDIAQEQSVFQASLRQACKQGLEEFIHVLRLDTTACIDDIDLHESIFEPRHNS